MNGDSGAPDGFTFHRERGVAALVRKGDEAILAPLERVLRGEPLEGGDGRSFRGRGAVASAPLPGRPDERIIVRRYRHGGALRFLGGRIVLGANRPFQELRALAAAAAAGVPVVRPIAALSTRIAPGLLFRGLLATREEEGSADLLEWLRRAPRDRAERRDLARHLAVAVRRLHDAGIFHADLHVKNVLVRKEKEGVENGVVLVDFDRARVLGRPLSKRLRFRNLFRLDRSLEKTGLAPARVSRTDRIACLRAYLGPDVRRLARTPGLRARLFWGRVGLAFHRLSWRLDGTPA